jgi:O-antigen/teichoic acid export membrane protein
MGDVAVVSTILAGLEMIADLGIGINVVQHPRGREKAFLGTAFAIQIARGLLLWALASAAAFPIAAIYHAAQLGPLLMFGAVGVGLRGFFNPRIYTFNRALELRWPTLLSSGSEIFGFVVTVAWAFIHPSAWALVGGAVGSALFNTVASLLVTRAPRPSWDRELASEIIRFGGWTILSTGSYFLSSRGENLMLKGSTPDVEFGCFAFASMLVTTPVIAITQLATQVLFPMMSTSVREGGGAADRMYRQSKLVFTFLASLVASGMILLGPIAIGFLNLNSSYASLSWMVPFLGFRAAMDVYAVPAGNVLFASGAMRFSAVANVIRLITLVAGLALVLHPYGLHGAIWVLVGAPMLSYFALMPGLRRYVPGTLWLEAQCFAAFVGTAAASALLAQHLR